jgi:hypothetical protein
MSAQHQSLMRLCRFGVRCLGTALPEPKLASAFKESGSKLPHSKKAAGKGTK